MIQETHASTQKGESMSLKHGGYIETTFFHVVFEETDLHPNIRWNQKSPSHPNGNRGLGSCRRRALANWQAVMLEGGCNRAVGVAREGKAPGSSEWAFFGVFRGYISDLHLADQKVTWKKLAANNIRFFPSLLSCEAITNFQSAQLSFRW